MPTTVRTRGLRRRTIHPDRLRRQADAMLLALGQPDSELSVLLCDDRSIRDLNRDYRERDEATDVLAFAMREGEGGSLHPQLLGDVVISVETARRQAARRGVPVAREVLFLLGHGLLHLLGFDHRTRDEERRMNARTDALVAAARRSQIAQDR